MAMRVFTTPIASKLAEHYRSLWMEPRLSSEQTLICTLVQGIEESTDRGERARKQAALRRRNVSWTELVKRYAGGQ